MRNYKPYTQRGDSWMVPGSFMKWARTSLLIQPFVFIYYNIRIIMVLMAKIKETDKDVN